MATIVQFKAGSGTGASSNTSQAYQAAPSLASVLMADGLPCGADH